MYEIRFALEAKKDLARFRAFDRGRILDDIERQLTYEPRSLSRNRKLLVGLVPPWAATEPIWELRVGEYRVFYDVEEAERRVVVRAVRRKRSGRTTQEVI